MAVHTSPIDSSNGDRWNEHTPAPWYVRGCELIGSSTVLATLYWHSGRDRQNEADKALIATAPELLQALSDMLILAEGAGLLGSQKAQRAYEVMLKARGQLSEQEGK